MTEERVLRIYFCNQCGEVFGLDDERMNDVRRDAMYHLQNDMKTRDRFYDHCCKRYDGYGQVVVLKLVRGADGTRVYYYAPGISSEQYPDPEIHTVSIRMRVRTNRRVKALEAITKVV